MLSTSYNIDIPDNWNKETYKEFLKNLLLLQDKKYLTFNQRITPTTYQMIGIRVPILRKISKSIKKGDYLSFLDNAESTYFEEILLEGFVISYEKDYSVFLKYFYQFLPHIDNWAVCDLCVSSFSIIKKHKEEFFPIILELIHKSPFEIRVGIVCLLDHYADDSRYLSKIFSILNQVDCDEYYVSMALSWLISVLFIYDRESTLSYLKDNSLPPFVQNKAISKIRDSYRVSREDKELVLQYKK